MKCCAVILLALAPARTSADDAKIQRLVEQLGSGSYSERVEATEQLIIVGPRATEALRDATRGDDFEVAIRARHLLRLMDELLFAGVSVELRASSTRIAWSDGFDLELRATNTTKHRARLPFEELGAFPPGGQDRLAQVSAMLDLADFLVVTGPDGNNVSLFVDDINEDPRMLAAVNRRIDDPPITSLAPHGARTHRVERFNRGWSRFRFLRAGDYHVQFVYQPQWDDAEMQQAGVGRVESNPVVITVTEPAPECVRRANAAASLRVDTKGDEFVATLMNRSDVPVWVNLNIVPGRSTPFASLRWSVARQGAIEELPAPRASKASAFSNDRLKLLAPADRVELGRLPRAAVTGGDECEVVVTYTNVTGLAWQVQNADALRRHPGAPQSLRAPLPQRMLATALSARADCPPATSE